MWVGCGCLTMLAVPLGVVLFWQFANIIPTYPPSAPVTVPTPNALDDYMAAAELAQKAREAEAARFPRATRTEVQDAFLRVPFWPDVPTPMVREFVERNREALARLRTGFGKQYAVPRYTLWSRRRPRWLHFWTLARALRTEGELAEREGNAGAAARSYLDCLRVGVDLPRGAGDLVAGRMGVLIQNIGMEGLYEVIERLDAGEARRVLREMQALEASAVPLSSVVLQERDAATQNLVIALRHPPSRMSLYVDWDHRDFQDHLRFNFTPKRLLLDRFRAYMQRWATICKDPYHAGHTPPRRPFDPVSRRGIQNVARTRLAWAKRDALWRLMECRLALRAYRAERGAPPASLEMLVPAYMPSVPRDPFAPHPLTYAAQGERYLLYSLGPDGDDDGGRQLDGKLEVETDSDLGEPRVLPP